MRFILLFLITCTSFLAAAQDTATRKRDKKHLIKTDIFSLALGHASIAYEKSIKPGKSFEIGLGIIGRGFKKDEKASGFFIKTGYKFSNSSALNTRYPHLMDGIYARPEISFSSYKQQLGSPSTHISHSIKYMTAGLNLGLQEVVGKIVVLDVFAGINYGVINARQYNSRLPNTSQEAKDIVVYHGLLGTTGYTPVFLSGGLKVGFLLP